MVPFKSQAFGTLLLLFAWAAHAADSPTSSQVPHPKQPLCGEIEAMGMIRKNPWRLVVYEGMDAERRFLLDVKACKACEALTGLAVKMKLRARDPEKPAAVLRMQAQAFAPDLASAEALKILKKEECRIPKAE